MEILFKKTLQPGKSHNTWDIMGRFQCGQLKWNHEISKIFLLEENLIWTIDGS